MSHSKQHLKSELTGDSSQIRWKQVVLVYTRTSRARVRFCSACSSASSAIARRRSARAAPQRARGRGPSSGLTSRGPEAAPKFGSDKHEGMPTSRAPRLSVRPAETETGEWLKSRDCGEKVLVVAPWAPPELAVLHSQL